MQDSWQIASRYETLRRTASDHPKRRSFITYSVRMLLLLTTLLAIVVGLLANRVREQRRIVSNVLRAGGTVYYDFQKHDPDLPNVFDKKAPPPGPNWLRQLIGDELFQDVVMIDFANRPITDEDLVQLKKLPKIENLNLNNTKVTSAGLAHIADLRDMRYLALWNTSVDDEGLRHLAHLQSMYALVLDGTQVTDNGLRHLRGLTNLEEWLGLVGTNVSNAGLEHLKGMTKLHVLNVRQTKVTADGAKELERVLPNLSVSYGR